MLKKKKKKRLKKIEKKRKEKNIKKLPELTIDFIIAHLIFKCTNDPSN